MCHATPSNVKVLIKYGSSAGQVTGSEATQTCSIWIGDGGMVLSLTGWFGRPWYKAMKIALLPLGIHNFGGKDSTTTCPSESSCRHTPSSVTCLATVNSLAPLGVIGVIVVVDLGGMEVVGSGGLIGVEDGSMEGLRGVETGASEGCKLCIFMGMADMWID
jgi:hypothetical protein